MNDLSSAESAEASSPQELVCGSCATPIPPGERYCPQCLAPAARAVPAGPASVASTTLSTGPEEEAPEAGPSGGPVAGELLCADCGTVIPPEKHHCPRCLAPASKAVRAGTATPPPAEEAPAVAAAPTLPPATALPADEELLCGNCAIVIPAGAQFCPECGVPVELAVAVWPGVSVAPEGAPEGAAEEEIGPTTVQQQPASLPPKAPLPSPQPVQRVSEPRPRQAPRAAERLIRDARTTLGMAILGGILALFGGFAWVVGMGLALFCVWKGRQLQRYPRPEVSREGQKALIVSIVVLVGAFLVAIIRAIA